MPDTSRVKGKPLKVRGRTIPYGEFTHRLGSLCLTLGFSRERIWDSEEAASGRVPEISWRWTGKNEAVVFLSCRVPYNPNWGGYCGHPQLLVRTEAVDEEGLSPAAFIAPFLRRYRFARDHVLLSTDKSGRHLITIPESLLENKADGRPRLLLDVAKVARQDREGSFVSVAASGSRRSYLLGDTLRERLEEKGFSWKTGRSVPIGSHLETDLFSFNDGGDGNDPDSLFAATLLPYLPEILAHPTPNLRAAEIHLGQIFARTVAALHAEYPGRDVLCLAGLDIDMSTLIGRREHCFVPWMACLARRGETLFMEQDDLFVRLMEEGERG